MRYVMSQVRSREIRSRGKNFRLEKKIHHTEQYVHTYEIVTQSYVHIFLEVEKKIPLPVKNGRINSTNPVYVCLGLG